MTKELADFLHGERSLDSHTRIAGVTRDEAKHMIEDVVVGGQGRTASELSATAWALWAIVVAVAVLMVVMGGLS